VGWQELDAKRELAAMCAVRLGVRGFRAEKAVEPRRSATAPGVLIAEKQGRPEKKADERNLRAKKTINKRKVVAHQAGEKEQTKDTKKARKRRLTGRGSPTGAGGRREGNMRDEKKGPPAQEVKRGKARAQEASSFDRPGAKKETIEQYIAKTSNIQD